MTGLYLTNSLTRKKEKFLPLTSDRVGIYTCGPTVYGFASIGNFRTYVTADILVRTFGFSGYRVRYVMNLTDVGHLTGDNLGDADLGEDRIEKSARKEGKSAWDIASFYADAFLQDFEELNLTKPANFAKATDHIKEQISLVKKIEKRGFAYKIEDGVYFDTLKYEKSTGRRYGELSTLDDIRRGARIEANPEKKNPRDFALWKFSYAGGRPFDSAQDDAASRRQMEWESPWGLGFPGWHIECSAMSMKYLGETFDIHTGGEDLRQTHHPNEIAQSEAATGKTFVNYWVHATFLKVDGKRMGKSLGNVYTLADIKKRGLNPLALRYLFLTSHYRDSLNFTWKSLGAAAAALQKLRDQVAAARTQTQRTALSEEKEVKVENFRQDFAEAIADDLDTPKALAVLWFMLKSNIPSQDKYDLALSFDEVLGLKLSQITNYKLQITDKVKKLLEERERLRKEGNFKEADRLREEINNLGYTLEDTAAGSQVKPMRKPVAKR